MFLTAEELATLTGKRRASLQIAALRKMGVAHWINAAGKPVVTRAAVEGREKDVDRGWRPNVLRAA